MIPYDRIILEIERQLGVAKRSADESAMREALTAVRSLCEVALGAESPRAEAYKAAPLEVAVAPKTITSLESKPFVEKDANGGSIFDF